MLTMRSFWVLCFGCVRGLIGLLALVVFAFVYQAERLIASERETRADLCQHHRSAYKLKCFITERFVVKKGERTLAARIAACQSAHDLFCEYVHISGAV